MPIDCKMKLKILLKKYKIYEFDEKEGWWTVSTTCQIIDKWESGAIKWLNWGRGKKKSQKWLWIFISKGNNLIIKELGKTPGKTDEAFKYFCKHDPLYNYAAEIDHEMILSSNHIKYSEK